MYYKGSYDKIDSVDAIDRIKEISTISRKQEYLLCDMLNIFSNNKNNVSFQIGKNLGFQYKTGFLVPKTIYFIFIIASLFYSIIVSVPSSVRT
jgi:hypothetical protein